MNSAGQGVDHRANRQEKREQTRTALLDAAERLWAERGIHGASLDEIAAAAGLTKGAVYSNFTGKTDLLLALLDRYTQAHLTLPISAADAKPVAMLLVEFWLYGMRDYAAGWRIADWYHQRRAALAADLTETETDTEAETMPAADRAAFVLAVELGLALQHLLDPERVPAKTYTTGLRLTLGPCGTDCMITTG